MIVYFVLQNWANEVDKWLGGKLNCLSIDSGTKVEIDRKLGMGIINSVVCHIHINIYIVWFGLVNCSTLYFIRAALSHSSVDYII